MGRNELYITIPNLFRCPISLDVMKSPVSLCTGVTYDRSSIQHWLDSGHDTCPATMQTLPTKDFVPNLTLHRLINLWNQSSSSRRSDSSPTTVSEKQVKIWIEDIKSQKAEQSLVKIVDLLSYSENKKFLAEFEYFTESIVCVMSRDVDIKILELIVRVLDLILLQIGVKEKLQRLIDRNCLSSFLLIINHGNLASKIDAIRVLQSISLDINDSKRFTPVVLDLLKTNSDNHALNDAVLSFLVSATTTRSVKTQLVQLGLVELISKILSSQKATVSAAENALKLLSSVSTCADGRLAISEDPRCAECIVERLMKVSKRATEDGVMVLWSLCCLFKDEKVKEKVVRNNGLTKVLLVMQSEGEGNVRKMCAELVKVLRAGLKDINGSLGVMCYETKTTHIMPC